MGGDQDGTTPVTGWAEKPVPQACHESLELSESHFMLLGEFPMCLCSRLQHQIRTGQFLDCGPRTCPTPRSPPGLEYHNPVQCLAPFCGQTFRLLQFTTKEHMHKKQKGPCLTLRWCELEKRKRHIHLTAPPARRPAKECGLDGRLSTAVCGAGVGGGDAMMGPPRLLSLHHVEGLVFTRRSGNPREK